MAGGQERILRGRIRSVQATKKITRAMELIAGSRIVKAQQRVQAAVPYSEKITEVVKDLAAGGGSAEMPLLAGRDEIRKTCYVAIAADRGLNGGYNAGVQRATEGEVKADVANGKDYLIVPVGKKPDAYFRFRGYTLGESFQGFTANPGYADAKAIGDYVIDLFTRGEVDNVELIYTRFITAGIAGGRPAAPRPADRRGRRRWRRPADVHGRRRAALRRTSSSPTRRRSCSSEREQASRPMAGGQERILRGRIRSVQATKKITRAMELIAGSRIVKAQQRVQAAVPYSEKITEVVKDLAAGGGRPRCRCSPGATRSARRATS